MSTTAEDICRGALIEVADFGDQFPSSRPAMYRRISRRQQELFAWVATVDYNYYGICAIGDVVNGGVDILKITGDDFDLPPAVESLTKVEVWTPKDGSPYQQEDPITVVNLLDTEMGFSPRVVLRDGVLWQVGADLETISQIRIHYSKRSRPIKSGDQNIELPDSFADLLVFDLCKALLERASAISKETRDFAMEYFAKQEAAMLAEFEAHVRNYSPMQTRFEFNPTNSRAGSALP